MEKFSAFYKENYSCVVGVAERRLGSLRDAEEIASDAFRIAWERYKEGVPLSVPWLYGVVRNLIGDEYRRRNRRTELQDHLNADFTMKMPFSQELRADVRDAVERLPPKDCAILRMAYWERLTSEEIAVILDINSAAVRARIMRARRMVLAALMASEEEFGGENDVRRKIGANERSSRRSDQGC